MAYVYAADAPVGEAMCKERKHHWHMDGKYVSCCRCELRQKYKSQVSEGPHDDRGDKE